METSGGIQASLQGRYASALFALARDQKAIGQVEASLAVLEDALAQSADLKALMTNPLIARAAAARTIQAVAGELRLDPLTTKFLGVLAQNRRLAQVPAAIAAFRQLAARHRGETRAEVTSAHPLDRQQLDQLGAKLKARVGRDVTVATKVDPAILGGLVVRIGAQMIDSSIRTKLNTLAVAMKG
ncbi:MAG: F0F1 ATP synthase subunit delta [Sphingomonadaceae bacterium]